MGLFKKKDPQEAFEGLDFTITNTLLDGSMLTGIPSIYVDEPARRWAVRLPGQVPAIFDFDDLLECEIVEAEPADFSALSSRQLALEIMKNPQAVSKANAAKQGSCTGMSVIVMVRIESGDPARLEIPIITRPTSRTSLAYRQLVAFARELEEGLRRMRS